MVSDALQERRRHARREEDRVTRIEARVEALDTKIGDKLDALTRLVIDLKARFDVSGDGLTTIRTTLSQHETRLAQFEREMVVVRSSGRGAWEVAKLVLGPAFGVLIGLLAAGQARP